MATCGFLFAFKTYVPQCETNVPLDCIENLVHHLTHSDLIHVEIIPVWKRDAHDAVLLASDTAHTAYVGYGYNAHPSHTCLEDPTYVQLFVPVSEPHLHEEGIRFLHSMNGRRYNYLALPLTILPEFCKLRAIHTPHFFDTSKIFCSQMGLILCYLCRILHPEYHYHGQSIIFDPLCCTPADLYRLLMDHDYCGAVTVVNPSEQVRILSDSPNTPSITTAPPDRDGHAEAPDMFAIYGRPWLALTSEAR
jgi:hypothetical protein